MLLSTTSALLGILVTIPVGINSASVANKTIESKRLGVNQDFCPPNYRPNTQDLQVFFAQNVLAQRLQRSLENQATLQCTETSLCDEIDLSTVVAECSLTPDVYAVQPKWDCSVNLPEKQVSISKYRVDCEQHPFNEKCTLTGSCILYFTPGRGSNLVWYLVIAGIAALALVLAGVGYFVYARRNRGQRVSTTEN